MAGYVDLTGSTLGSLEVTGIHRYGRDLTYKVTCNLCKTEFTRSHVRLTASDHGCVNPYCRAGLGLVDSVDMDRDAKAEWRKELKQEVIRQCLQQSPDFVNTPKNRQAMADYMNSRGKEACVLADHQFAYEQLRWAGKLEVRNKA